MAKRLENSLEFPLEPPLVYMTVQSLGAVWESGLGNKSVISWVVVWEHTLE